MILPELIGESAGIAAIRNTVASLLDRAAGGRRLPPVLLQGETGTGKGLVAGSLHRASPRRHRPFVDVNCAAIPETLLEAEMFGFERGAFTGAERAKAGLFQTANGGTIFLDEIGLLPHALQAKLLKVIEERAVRRLGRTRSEPLDIWVFTATSEDLEAATRTHAFRPELYHRLAVVTLRLPPLRERGEDLDLLAEHFLARACSDYGLPRKHLGKDARAALHGYRWPGNVRELANVLERAALLSDGSALTAQALGLKSEVDADVGEPRGPRDGGSLKALVRTAERDRLLAVLEHTRWNLSHAAAELDIPRATLVYRMERHGLRRPPPSRRRETASETQAQREASDSLSSAVVTGSGDRVRRRLTWLRAVVGDVFPGAMVDGSRAIEIVAEKVDAFGGRIEALGHGRLTATFGTQPVEDGHRRAALAALAIQKALERERQTTALQGAVSIGIHVGDALVTDAAGRVVVDAEGQRAAEMALDALLDGAPPHAVRATQPAARALERRFEIEPAEQASAGIYRLTGRERTGLGPAGEVARLVGRRQELELLEARLGAALAGRGHLVAIVGEAGIGKSRLLFELRRGVEAEQLTFLEGRCHSYASRTPFAPLVEIVRQQCGITEADDSGVVANKVRQALETAGLDASEHAVYLGRLLGIADRAENLRDIGAEVMKARITEAFTQLVVRVSQRRPLVLAVEDLHWIDTASDELLAVLIDAIPGAPLLLMVTYRPEYRPAWLARSYVTKVALPPLSTDDSLAVLRSALQVTDVSPDVIALAVARADGNPFFLEELARAIGDHGGAAAAVAVPDTIEGVLTARIDRLEPSERRLLQAAAVLGKDVRVALLEAMREGRDVDLRQRLSALRRAEFLYETRAAPDLEYTFKHTLTCEVAYGGIPPQERQSLHLAAARAMIRTWPDIAETRPELVAHHLTAAEALHDAVPLWVRAGRNAIRRSANVEAIGHLRTARDLLTTLPHTRERDQQELEIQVTLGPALIMTNGYAAAEVESVYERARGLCEQLGEGPRLLWAWRGIWLYHLIRGDIRWAQDIGEQLVTLAARSGDASALARAHVALGASLFYRGSFLLARGHLETGIRLLREAETDGDREPEASVEALGFLAWTLGFQGHETEALEHVGAAVRRAEKSGRAFMHANALNFAALLHQLRRDFMASGAYAERTLAIAHEHRFLHVIGEATWVRGRALAAAGQQADALALMREGLTTIRATGARLANTYHLSHLAEVLMAAGDAERALAHLDEGLALAEQNDERFYLPELHRLRAELLACHPDGAREAEISFESAIALARHQGSRVLAGRAADSFVTYLRERGRDLDAARVLNAPDDDSLEHPAA